MRPFLSCFPLASPALARLGLSSHPPYDTVPELPSGFRSPDRVAIIGTGKVVFRRRAFYFSGLTIPLRIGCNVSFSSKVVTFNVPPVVFGL